MKKIFLTVVIPSYDEMGNLQKGVLDKVAHFLNKKKISYEVIIVDDGSKDGSVQTVEHFVKENPRFKLIKNFHLGKAGTVTTGMMNAKGEYILFTDMDQATPIEEIDRLLPFLEKTYDIVIGSRSNKRKGAPFSRLVISRISIILRKLIVGMNDISDTQCGFKAFKKNAAREIFSKIYDLHNGYKEISGSAVTSGFDVELLYIARRMGYRIKEVSVDWLYVETRRVNTIRESIDGFIDLLRIKKNAMMGKYD